MKVEKFLDDVRNGYSPDLINRRKLNSKQAGVETNFVIQRVSALSKHFNNPDLITDDVRVDMSE